MKRFIEGLDRSQTTLLPDCLDDYVDEDNPVRAVDAFVDMLDLASLGFDIEPEATGRPGYHPASMLKLYVYGYLNQVQSSRRLERECARNLELIWLLFVVGLVAASFASALAAGQFRPQRPTVSQAARGLTGGILMGWGAMTGLGCTVGVSPVRHPCWCGVRMDVPCFLWSRRVGGAYLA